MLELYIALFDKKEFIKLGRSGDCDIKVSDISVSRSHARILKEFDNFYIEDYKSKFGSLCKIKDVIEFSELS